MSATRRLRRPAKGGYARGDGTRQKIVEAAVSLFGQYGFAGASTRIIAARAGVTAPALQYYFENKEGLYRACAEALADAAWQVLGPAVRCAQQALDRDEPDSTLIDVFLLLQSAMADLMLQKGCQTDRRLFFAREQSGGEPEIGTQVLRERLRAPLNQVSAALLARITGKSESDPVTIVRMFSLIGQFFVFHVPREATLSLYGWGDIEVGNVDFVKDNIGAQTRLLLDCWQKQRDSASHCQQATPSC